MPENPQQMVVLRIQHPEGLKALNLSETCKQIGAKILGLQSETNGAIQGVLVFAGKKCLIYHPPNMSCDYQGDVPIDSYTAVDGVVVVWVYDGSVQLMDGNAVTEIQQGVCGQFPDAHVTVHGLEIQPDGQGPVIYRSTVGKEGWKLQVEGGAVKVKTADIDGTVVDQLIAGDHGSYDSQGGVLNAATDRRIKSEVGAAQKHPPDCGIGHENPSGLGGVEVLLIASAALMAARAAVDTSGKPGRVKKMGGGKKMHC